jgi:hypothetical protein
MSSRFTLAGVEISKERVSQIIESEEMPGTRKNPLGPGVTSDEYDAIRAAWAAADPLTQEQRTENARHGLIVERDERGYVIER